MGQETGIEWCDHTFNIVWGCTKVSPACKNCYAEDWAARFGVGWGPDAERKTFGDKHWAEPLKWARRAARDGVRRRVFTSSMADVFEDHPTVAQERRRLWRLIEATCYALDWQVLTKRPERIAAALMDDDRPADFLRRCGVWLMTTVESQEWADRRIDPLLKVPAAVHGLSCEPLLGELNLDRWLWSPGGVVETDLGPEGYDPQPSGDIGWIIGGGESGPGARPSHTDWFRSLRDQCRAAEVPYFFKQWGDWMPDGQGPRWLRDVGGGRDAHDVYDGFPDIVTRRLGKKKAGRRLDGVEHGEFPEPEVARA